MSVFSYGFSYLSKPKEYTWIKKGQEGISLKEIERIVEKEKEIMPEKKSKESKLKKLAWTLETKPKELEEMNITPEAEEVLKEEAPPIQGDLLKMQEEEKPQDKH